MTNKNAITLLPCLFPPTLEDQKTLQENITHIWTTIIKLSLAKKKKYVKKNIFFGKVINKRTNEQKQQQQQRIKFEFVMGDV